MSLQLTTLGRQFMINAFWAPDVYSPIPNVYLCYTTSTPPSNASGDQLTEPDPASSYSRLAIPLNSSHWAPTGFGEVANAVQDFFAAPTADWGFIWGLALTDTGSVGAGNVIATGTVNEPFRAPVGATPVLNIGDITIGLYE